MAISHSQLDRSKPIPDTTVFDGVMSRRGYRLNKMCGSLITPETRAAFKADEEAYMNRYGLTEAEKALVRNRDFAGLIHGGLNIYFMLKLGACTGNGLYHMGAQMRGEKYEAFLATRNMKDAV
jgi:protocatechuate 4,5-dioxygenase, alpha chain